MLLSSPDGDPGRPASPLTAKAGMPPAGIALSPSWREGVQTVRGPCLGEARLRKVPGISNLQEGDVKESPGQRRVSLGCVTAKDYFPS